MPAIRWLAELRLSDLDDVGSKGANLGEMTAAGLPVPDGFVVTARSRPSAETAEAIVAAYRRLGDGVAVAVRSSVLGADSSGTGVAGRCPTFTNVRGESALLQRVADCWEPTTAVVVQTMIPAGRSGIVVTADPSTGDAGRLMVEAVLGQGQAVLSGLVEPDTYLVARNPLHVIGVRIGQRTVKIVRGPDGADLDLPTTEDEQDERVLTGEQILEVARLGLAVQEHYGAPQEIEWAVADGRTWLVQCRPTSGPLALPRPGRSGWDGGTSTGRPEARRRSDPTEGLVTP